MLTPRSRIPPLLLLLELSRQFLQTSPWYSTHHLVSNLHLRKFAPKLSLTAGYLLPVPSHLYFPIRHLIIVSIHSYDFKTGLLSGVMHVTEKGFKEFLLLPPEYCQI